jgi:hypothetical protein
MLRESQHSRGPPITASRTGSLLLIMTPTGRCPRSSESALIRTSVDHNGLRIGVWVRLKRGLAGSLFRRLHMLMYRYVRNQKGIGLHYNAVVGHG